ncbi:MAG: hypothetical protein C0410_08000, partial [Anaerolinea sp.]|nr:hypothetical protein [Anaerolinea sp.]
MAIIKTEIRRGVYIDSAKLMKLQRSLTELAGILDTGVIMGTDSNKELLAHIGLTSPEISAAKPDELVIALKADDVQSADFALSKVDELLAARKGNQDQDYQPHSLETAA